MIKKIYIAAAVGLVLASCDVSGVKKTDEVVNDNLTADSSSNTNNNVKVEDTVAVTREVKDLDSRVKIVWSKKNDSERLAPGDVIRIKHTLRLADGKVIETWKQLGRAGSICLNFGMAVKGWEEGLYQMGVGEEAKISVPADLAYGEKGMADIIPPNSNLLYEVEIVEKIEPVNLEEGVQVYVVERVKDSKPNGDLKGKEIQFGYMAFAQEKGMYDNSYRTGTVFKYNYGKPTVVPGLNIGIKEVRVRDKAYVKIPAKAAYGKKGLVDLVPSNTPILYDIMMVDIK